MQQRLQASRCPRPLDDSAKPASRSWAALYEYCQLTVDALDWQAITLSKPSPSGSVDDADGRIARKLEELDELTDELHQLQESSNCRSLPLLATSVVASDQCHCVPGVASTTDRPPEPMGTGDVCGAA